jgi:hypothetical protein
LAIVLALSVSVSASAETHLPKARLGRPLAKIKVQKIKMVTAAKSIVGAKVEVAQKPSPLGRPFIWEGEQIYYSVEVGGTDAARASLQVGKRKTKKGVSYLPLVGRVVTHGFFAKSYPMDNVADTFIRADTFQPIKSEKLLKEKGDYRKYVVRYEPRRYGADVNREVKKKGGKKKNRSYTRAVPNTIHDGLSWIYVLRSEALRQGDEYTYYIYDGWKLSRFKVTVVGKESVWTPLKEYETIKVDVERTVLNSKWKGKRGTRTVPAMTQREKPYYLSTLYLSDDELRIPVKIFVTSKKADSVMKLVKYVPPK